MPRAGASSETAIGVNRDGHVVSLLPVVSTLSSKGIRWDSFSLDAFQDIPVCEIPDHVHPTHMMSLLTRGSATDFNEDVKKSMSRYAW